MAWVPLAINGGSAAIEMVRWGKAAIDVMVAEGRDPTDAEWTELDARTTALRTALHSD